MAGSRTMMPGHIYGSNAIIVNGTVSTASTTVPMNGLISHNGLAGRNGSSSLTVMHNGYVKLENKPMSQYGLYNPNPQPNTLIPQNSIPQTSNTIQPMSSNHQLGLQSIPSATPISTPQLIQVSLH